MAFYRMRLEGFENNEEREYVLDYYLLALNSMQSGVIRYEALLGLIDYLSGKGVFESYFLRRGGMEYDIDERQIFEWALDMAIYDMSVRVSAEDEIDLEVAIKVIEMKGRMFGYDAGEGQNVVSQKSLLDYLKTKYQYNGLVNECAVLEGFMRGDGEIDEAMISDIELFLERLDEFRGVYPNWVFSNEMLEAFERLREVKIEGLDVLLESFNRELKNDDVWKLDGDLGFWKAVSRLIDLFEERRDEVGLSDVEELRLQELCYLEQLALGQGVAEGFKVVVENVGGWGDEVLWDRVEGFRVGLERAVKNKLLNNGFYQPDFVFGEKNLTYDEGQLMELSRILSVFFRADSELKFSFLSVASFLCNFGKEPYGYGNFYSDEYLNTELEKCKAGIEAGLMGGDLSLEDRIGLYMKKVSYCSLDEIERLDFENCLVDFFECEEAAFDAVFEKDGVLSVEDRKVVLNIAMSFYYAFSLCAPDGPFRGRFGSSLKYLGVLVAKEDPFEEGEATVGELYYGLRSINYCIKEFVGHLELCKQMGRMISFDFRTLDGVGMVEEGEGDGGNYVVFSNVSYCRFLLGLIDAQIKLFGDQAYELKDLKYKVLDFLEVLKIGGHLKKLASGDLNDDQRREIEDKLLDLFRIKKEEFGVRLDRIEEDCQGFIELGREGIGG